MCHKLYFSQFTFTDKSINGVTYAGFLTECTNICEICAVFLIKLRDTLKLGKLGEAG